MNIYYCSGTGNEKLDFMNETYRVNVQELISYEWEYGMSENIGRNGGKITDFKRSIAQKEITVAISGRNRTIYSEALNLFLMVTERDIQNLTPGRLYMGENYLTCYLINSSPSSAWNPWITFMEKQVSVLSEYPFWCTETTIEYLPSRRIEAESPYLDYSYCYPYDYLRDMSGIRILENGHFSSCDFQIVVYGPVLNPKIEIAGHPYEVYTTLYDDEYMMIDSRNGKVWKKTKDGNETNLFNYRRKDQSIFQKIPPGNSPVVFNQQFGFSVTLFKERSEPEWST